MRRRTQLSAAAEAESCSEAAYAAAYLTGLLEGFHIDSEAAYAAAYAAAAALKRQSYSEAAYAAAYVVSSWYFDHACF